MLRYTLFEPAYLPIRSPGSPIQGIAYLPVDEVRRRREIFCAEALKKQFSTSFGRRQAIQAEEPKVSISSRATSVGRAHGFPHVCDRARYAQ